MTTDPNPTGPAPFPPKVDLVPEPPPQPTPLGVRDTAVQLELFPPVLDQPSRREARP